MENVFVMIVHFLLSTGEHESHYWMADDLMTIGQCIERSDKLGVEAVGNILENLENRDIEAFSLSPACVSLEDLATMGAIAATRAGDGL